MISTIALLVYAATFATEIFICITLTNAAKSVVQSFEGGGGTDTLCCVYLEKDRAGIPAAPEDDPTSEEAWEEQKKKYKKREELFKHREEVLDAQEKQPFDFNKPIDKPPAVKVPRKKVSTATKTLLEQADSSNLVEIKNEK